MGAKFHSLWKVPCSLFCGRSGLSAVLAHEAGELGWCAAPSAQRCAQRCAFGPTVRVWRRLAINNSVIPTKLAPLGQTRTVRADGAEPRRSAGLRLGWRRLGAPLLGAGARQGGRAAPGGPGYGRNATSCGSTGAGNSVRPRGSSPTAVRPRR